MIEKTIVVRVAPEVAFRTWTERVHLWWPAGHRMSGEPDGRLVFEGRVGGRLVEQGTGGREWVYGEVLAFEPPSLLRHTFVPGTGAARPTLVEVRFETVAEGTRVVVRHTAGEAGDVFGRTAPRFERNWTDILQAFATATAR